MALFVEADILTFSKMLTPAAASIAVSHVYVTYLIYVSRLDIAQPECSWGIGEGTNMLYTDTSEHNP